MKITWLTQGSFLFESNGIRILVDPYMSDCLETEGLKRMVEFTLLFEELKPDMLICTHDHLDHLDPETVKKIAEMYPECIIAGPKSCYDHFKKLEIAESRIKLLKRGKAYVLSNIKITPVTAIHSDSEAVGIVIETEGKKLYLSGDSLYAAELVNDFTKNCDCILICINGRLGNMTINDALKISKAVKAVTALPMHYGLFAENTVNPQPFIDGCIAHGIKSFEMIAGRGFVL